MISSSHPLPRVPEELLRKRKQYQALKAKQAKAAVLNKQVGKNPKHLKFKRAEEFVKEHRMRERDEMRLRVESRMRPKYYVPEEPKLAIVIRIEKAKQAAAKVKKVLQLLRLREVNNAVFVELNKTTLQMLQIAQPFITWGYPDLKTVRDLIFKRGHGRVNKSRVPLTDNTIVEDALSDKGMICVEDLVHELFSIGPNFKAASSFLWPFKLSYPRGGFIRKFAHFEKGGNYGNRKEEINALVRKMN